MQKKWKCEKKSVGGSKKETLEHQRQDYIEA